MQEFLFTTEMKMYVDTFRAGEDIGDDEGLLSRI